MILRHGLFITFVLFSFNFLPFVYYARLVSCVTLASFVRIVHFVRSVTFIWLVRPLRYLRFVPSIRLIFPSCSFPVPFLCPVNYISSFNSVCSVTSGIRSWLSGEQLKSNALIGNLLLLFIYYYYFTNLFCRDCTFCSLNFNSSANLSFSSVIFSSL